MDLIIGRLGGSVLMTAVERKTRFTVIALAPNKTAEAVKEAILGALFPLAAPVETLTYDNGKEFALHEVIAQQLQAESYFAHPYHSWERGLNENKAVTATRAVHGSEFPKLNNEAWLQFTRQLYTAADGAGPIGGGAARPVGAISLPGCGTPVAAARADIRHPQF